MYKQHKQEKIRIHNEMCAEVKKLAEMQVVYRQYQRMTTVMVEEMKRLICEIQAWKEEMKANQEHEEEPSDLITGLENTLKVMATNAAKMILLSKESEGTVEIRHWANRERFCRKLIELIESRNSSTQQNVDHGGGRKLGQSNALLYGGGHGPPWKGRAPPLVLAGKAGARGSEQFYLGCSQPELISCLPTGPDPCAYREFFASRAHELASSSSSFRLGGRVENHDRKQPMVPSALSTKSFLSKGSTWQLSGGHHILEEVRATSGGIGSLTEPESRLADAHEGDFENLSEGIGKNAEDRSQSEERE
jgi:hypothetical protein